MIFYVCLLAGLSLFACSVKDKKVLAGVQPETYQV